MLGCFPLQSTSPRRSLCAHQRHLPRNRDCVQDSETEPVQLHNTNGSLGDTPSAQHFVVGLIFFLWELGGGTGKSRGFGDSKVDSRPSFVTFSCGMLKNH